MAIVEEDLVNLSHGGLGHIDEGGKGGDGNGVGCLVAVDGGSGEGLHYGTHCLGGVFLRVGLRVGPVGIVFVAGGEREGCKEEACGAD